MADSLTRRRLWTGIGIALVGFVVYQSLTPAPLEIDAGSGNALGHLAAYGTLMLWHCQLHDGRRRPVLALALAAMGLVLEFAQGMTGYRTFDLNDELANVTGVALGWLLAPPRMPNFLIAVERLMRN
jgi:hypothetical protein